MSGKLYALSSGPGAADLITVRAALRKRAFAPRQRATLPSMGAGMSGVQHLHWPGESSPW